MNLLDQFILQHVQVSVLNSELLRVTDREAVRDARVELNLSPRVLEPDGETQLPVYQVSARLSCETGSDDSDDPAFSAMVGIEAVYRQINGDPVDVAEFTAQHGSLARQLYPLLQQEMRSLLARMGLAQIQLPFDLEPNMPNVEGPTVEVAPSLH